MAETVREVFERRKQDPYEPRLAGVTGSYRFDIEDVGSFFVDVDDGHVIVSDEAHDADCTIGCSEEDFLAIAHGRQNLLTAAMQGRVVVVGDLELAQKLYGILPMPPEQPGAQP
jgi:putative sterol carrier protein